MAGEYSIGDIIQGEVTGIQKYGVFVKLDDDTQGLVHISECQHGFVSGVDKIVEVGDQIKVMVIDKDEYSKKISLSIRQLIADNSPLYPARQKKRSKRYTPNIGFKTIESKMPEWIRKGLEIAENDELNLNRNKGE